MKKDNTKSANYLNQRISTILKNGYRPITDFSHVKQNFSWILKPSGRKNSEMIMTYEEAKAQLAKKFPDQPLTREEYLNQLKEFQEEFADRLTLYGEKRYQKSYMETVISDAEEYTGEFVDTRGYSTEKLKNAFKYARDQTAGIKTFGGDSYTFYDYLIDYLKNR